jgi:hypothetical protein
MKIGVLTFHNTPNFGATLQCYGLLRHLQGRGHEVEVVNYTPPAAFRAYRKELFGGPKRSWRNVGRAARFYKFVTEKIPLSGKHLDNPADLVGLKSRYDLLIVGSDEVWKIEPRLRPFDSSYYLDFADRNRSRIVSYAASASTKSDMRDKAPVIVPLLDRLHAISVRDRNTAKMVSELTGREPVEVLDPTFLWDFKSEADLPLASGDYLALYGWPDARQSAALLDFARRRGLRFISVGCHNTLAERNYVGIGPVEWLRLIRHARYFVTDYFHGAAFALHFEIPFAVYVNPWKRIKIESLMEQAGVSHRLFPDIVSFADAETDQPVDFMEIADNLRPHLTRSVAFLDEQLSAAGGRAI